MALKSAKVFQLPKNSSAVDADWEWFWSIYPKKKAKLDAMKAWRQTEHMRPEIEKIIAAVDSQMQSDEWVRDGGQYIPWPAKWLRQGYWDND
jgi:hypothetical protein